MDGTRFDQWVRTFGSGLPRRRLLKGMLAGVFGAAGVAATDDADAGCTAALRKCKSDAQCCTGICADGRCACPAGTEACNAKCVEPCPPGQFRGSGCRCLCNTTGRPPINDACACGSNADCATTQTCVDGACIDASGGCGATSICFGDLVFCNEAADCVCDTTPSGGLVCADFFSDCSAPCGDTADCPSGFVCATQSCCGGPVCVPACGFGPGAFRTAGPRESSRGPLPDRDGDQ